ncbi:MAG: hypothetical protein Q9183_004944 [Haloplaca sp. 2 TL-2023]
MPELEGQAIVDERIRQQNESLQRAIDSQVNRYSNQQDLYGRQDYLQGNRYSNQQDLYSRQDYLQVNRYSNQQDLRGSQGYRQVNRYPGDQYLHGSQDYLQGNRYPSDQYLHGSQDYLPNHNQQYFHDDQQPIDPIRYRMNQGDQEIGPNIQNMAADYQTTSPGQSFVNPRSDTPFMAANPSLHAIQNQHYGYGGQQFVEPSPYRDLASSHQTWNPTQTTITSGYDIPSTRGFSAFQSQYNRLAAPIVQPSNSFSPGAIQHHRPRSGEGATGTAQAARRLSRIQRPGQAAIQHRQNHLPLPQTALQTPPGGQARSERPRTRRRNLTAAERTAERQAKKEAAEEKKRERTEGFAIWKQKREEQKAQHDQNEEELAEEQMKMFEDALGRHSVEKKNANEEGGIDEEEDADENRSASEEEN